MKTHVCRSNILSVTLLLMLLPSTGLFVSSCAWFDMEALRVEAWSPGSEYIADANLLTCQIGLKFSSDLDRASAEAAFALREDGVALSGSFVWDDGRTFRFVPSLPLKPGTRHLIVMSSSVHDLSGNSLDQSFSRTFSEGGLSLRPQIMSVQLTASGRLLTDGEVLSQQESASSIGIFFNVPVDPVSLDNAFSISPSFPGYFSVSPDRQSCNFRPNSSFTSPLLYTINISTTLTSLKGMALPKAWQLSFYAGSPGPQPQLITCQALRPSDALPSPGIALSLPVWPAVTQGLEADSRIRLVFDRNVDTSSVLDRITSTASVNFSLADPNTAYANELTLCPSERFRREAQYDLFLAAGWTDKEGRKGSAMRWSFSIDGPLTKPPSMDTARIAVQSATIGADGTVTWSMKTVPSQTAIDLRGCSQTSPATSLALDCILVLAGDSLADTENYRR